MIERVLLRSARAVWKRIDLRVERNLGRQWYIAPNKYYSNRLISEGIRRGGPLLVSRLGANELECVCNYLCIKGEILRSATGYIKGEAPPWWWDEGMLSNLFTGAGVFPDGEEEAAKMAARYIEDIPSIDILGSWLVRERLISTYLAAAKKVMLEDLEPFFAQEPWTHQLRGLDVLVVHPFEESIQRQYSRRDLVFPDGLLPDFNLKTMRAPQRTSETIRRYGSWSNSLEHLCETLETIKSDVVILGCGAYGLPLGAFAKRRGRVAIHLGGVVQLLFGIHGSRWENYIVYPYRNLLNDSWVRPDASERPPYAKEIEGGCYW
jgi:hypothetical protein